MIFIKEYSSSFEDKYYTMVSSYLNKNANGLTQRIITSSEKFLPSEFFVGTTDINSKFERLILAPYDKLNDAMKYIKDTSHATMKSECFYFDKLENKEKRTADYESYKNYYTKLMKQEILTRGPSNNVKYEANKAILIETGLLTCPYCNRDYINHRNHSISGAQLDHFYNKSQYPFFALSLYNLIPSCANCNKIKLDKDLEFVSPFDSTIDMNMDLNFIYNPHSVGKTIQIKTNGNMKTNSDILELENIYQLHEIDAREMDDRVRIYCSSQTREIDDTLKKHGISLGELDKALFGEETDLNLFGKRSLSKFRYDIKKQLLRERGLNK